jgi:hypothetical protein
MLNHPMSFSPPLATYDAIYMLLAMHVSTLANESFLNHFQCGHPHIEIVIFVLFAVQPPGYRDKNTSLKREGPFNMP